MKDKFPSTDTVDIFVKLSTLSTDALLLFLSFLFYCSRSLNSGDLLCCCALFINWNSFIFSSVSFILSIYLSIFLLFSLYAAYKCLIGSLSLEVISFLSFSFFQLFAQVDISHLKLIFLSFNLS
jgi:hypothetical protein